jgi:hypothetical protein
LRSVERALNLNFFSSILPVSSSRRVRDSSKVANEYYRKELLWGLLRMRDKGGRNVLVLSTKMSMSV